MAASLSRPGPAALKGVVVAVSTTALAVSAAAAYYGRRGWALPDNDEGLYRAFLDLMVGFATSDQPNGAVALLCKAALAAVLSGALAGRYAARVAGSKTERRRRIARVALLGYVGSALGIPVALGLVNAFLRARLEWSLPFLWLFVVAVFLLERWTRPTLEAGSAWTIAALLVGMAAVTTLLGKFAARQYLTADWKLATASGAACSVHRGMSRRSVRERCGSPTDLGVEQNRFTWALSAPRTCDVPVDAYNELLVLYDCRDEVAGVELFAARGIHRIFKDDFDAGHRTMGHQR